VAQLLVTEQIKPAPPSRSHGELSHRSHSEDRLLHRERMLTSLRQQDAEDERIELVDGCEGIHVTRATHARRVLEGAGIM